MNNISLLHKRVVLELESGVVFAGCLEDIVKYDNVEGYLIQMDSKINVKIWVAMSGVLQLTVIPIEEV